MDNHVFDIGQEEELARFARERGIVLSTRSATMVAGEPVGDRVPTIQVPRLNVRSLVPLPEGVSDEHRCLDKLGRRRPPFGDTVGSVPSCIWVTPPLLKSLENILKTNQEHTISHVAALAIKRAFVYLDVSDFSKYPALSQLAIVNSLALLARGCLEADTRRFASRLEAQICIGDGYVFVFRNALTAVYFGALIASAIQHGVARKRRLPVDFHFRIGIHAGEVYRFWDPGRNDWNYIGDGINGSQRVCSVIGRDTDDVVFVSTEVRDDLLAASSQHNDEDARVDAEVSIRHMKNRGRREDKHGERWRVYELETAGFTWQDEAIAALRFL